MFKKNEFQKICMYLDQKIKLNTSAQMNKYVLARELVDEYVYEGQEDCNKKVYNQKAENRLKLLKAESNGESYSENISLQLAFISIFIGFGGLYSEYLWFVSLVCLVTIFFAVLMRVFMERFGCVCRCANYVKAAIDEIEKQGEESRLEIKKKTKKKSKKKSKK